MGLDGISINQLRVTPELNSAELNSSVAINSNEVKVVDGLSSGQRVDPDKEKERENPQQDFENSESAEDENEEEQQEVVMKYDLSDASKYSLILDEPSNKIEIIEKSSKKVIQIIDADILSKFVAYAPDSCGSMVNKKF